MKKFLSKGKSILQEFQDSSSAQNPLPQLSQVSTITPPTPTDLIRYRYHHGTNLGSVFVLEQWLSGSMFPGGSPGGSELDTVTTSIKIHGLEATREKWEGHWRDAVLEQDFEWLVKEARCTSIRLPIGYFTLGEEWCEGTPFEKVGGVYVNAWNAAREFMGRAKGWGIGVLVDFHAVQGGANGEEHSGSTSGKAELWDSRRNRESAKKAFGFIASEIRNGYLESVMGIQVVNEATHNARGMHDWYEEVIEEIGSMDESIPIYVSDAWDLETCLKWVIARHPFKTGFRNPITVDTHRYYTFSDKDRNQSPQEIIGRIGSEVEELNGKEGALGEAQVIIGEWSCCFHLSGFVMAWAAVKHAGLGRRATPGLKQ